MRLLAAPPYPRTSSSPSFVLWLVTQLIVNWKNELTVRQSIAQDPRYPDTGQSLFEFCIRLLAVLTLPKDVIPFLRLIVLLTHAEDMTEQFERNRAGLFLQYSGLAVRTYVLPASPLS